MPSYPSEDPSPGTQAQTKRPSLVHAHSSSSATIGRSPPTHSPSHRGLQRPVKHVARGHHARVAPRNTSVNKDLNKLKNHGQLQTHVNDTGKHHRRSLSGDTESGSGSPRPGQVKRNASTAVISRNTSHTTLALKKTHSVGHLPLKGGTKAMSTARKSAMKRGTKTPPRKPSTSESEDAGLGLSMAAPNPTVRFNLGNKEEDRGNASEEWTEESASVSPQLMRSKPPAAPQKPSIRFAPTATEVSEYSRQTNVAQQSDSLSHPPPGVIHTTGLRITGEPDEDEDGDTDDEGETSESESAPESSAPPTPHLELTKHEEDAKPKETESPAESSRPATTDKRHPPKQTEQDKIDDRAEAESSSQFEGGPSASKVGKSENAKHSEVVANLPTRSSARILVPQDTDNKKLTQMLLNRPVSRVRSSASLHVSAVTATGEPESHAHHSPASQSPNAAGGVAVPTMAASSRGDTLNGRDKVNIYSTPRGDILISRFDEGSASSKATPAEPGVVMNTNGKGKQKATEQEAGKTESTSAPTQTPKKKVGFATLALEQARPASQDSDKHRPGSSDSARPISQSGVFDLNAGGTSRTQHKLELQRMVASLGPSHQVLPASLPLGTAPPLDYDYVFNHDARVDARLRSHYRQGKRELRKSVRRFHQPVLLSLARLYHLPTDRSRARLERRRAHLTAKGYGRPSSSRKKSFKERVSSFWTGRRGSQPAPAESRRPSIQQDPAEVANARQKRRERKQKTKQLKAQLWHLEGTGGF